MNVKNKYYNPAMNQASDVHQPNSSTIEEVDDKSSDGTANVANHNEINDANKTSSSYTRTSLPKQILKDGQFIIEDGSNSSRQILWNPNIESNTRRSFFPFKLRRVLLRYIRYRETNENENNIVADCGNDGVYQHVSPLANNERDRTSNNDGDIEAQYPDIIQQQQDLADGIHIPTRNSLHRKYVFGDRIKSRLERDEIIDYTNSEDNIGVSDKTDFVFKRPQDVLIVDSKKPCKSDSEYRNNHTNTIDCDVSTLLSIHIQNAKIHDHPHFIEEERLISTVDNLHKKMVSLNETEKMRNFEIRLISILSEILDLDELKAESKVPELIDCTQFTHLYEAFVHIVSKIVELEFETHGLYSSILKHWEKVVRIRQGQGFQSTTCTLVKVSSENDNDNDVQRIDHQMKKFQLHCGQIQPSHTDSSFNWSQNLQDAIEAFYVAQSSRRTRQIISLQRGHDNVITNVSTFVQERKRRERIRSELYEGRLFVDDELIGSTGKIKMQWPAMVLAFDENFAILIHGKRPKISLHIVKVRMGLINETIFKVFINLPGRSDLVSNQQALEFYSPIHEWYQFSSTYLGTNYVKKKHRFVGSVSVKTHWRKSKLSSTWRHSYGTAYSVIKPDLNICSKQQKIIGFDRSRSKLSPTTHNSPMRLKPSVKAALNETSLRFTYEGTRHSFHNSRVLREPVRHKLMKQRYYNKFLSSDFSIPLEEKGVSIEDTHRVTSLNQLSQKSIVSN